MFKRPSCSCAVTIDDVTNDEGANGNTAKAGAAAAADDCGEAVAGVSNFLFNSEHKIDSDWSTRSDSHVAHREDNN